MSPLARERFDLALVGVYRAAAPSFWRRSSLVSDPQSCPRQRQTRLRDRREAGITRIVVRAPATLLDVVARALAARPAASHTADFRTPNLETKEP